MISTPQNPEKGSQVPSVRRAHLVLLVATVVVALLAAALLVSRGIGVQAASPGPGTPAGKPHHVFVINLENTGYDRAWGPTSQAPFLAHTLRQQGILLEDYYAIAGSSLPNYIAQISGQGPNRNTLNDCAVYHPFVKTGTGPYDQALGAGCLYPDSVPTLAGQLSGAGWTWRGYMEDMGTGCRHPEVGSVDTTKKARINDEYTTRHNPFLYFASITNSTDCARNDVDLSALTSDLASEKSTANLSYITPNLCDDGHDSPCVDGRPGGLVSADAWLRKWVPLITASPAFQDDGMLVVTFDEADKDSNPASQAESVAGAPLQNIVGSSGGKVGALVISRFVRPGSSSDVPYDHYSLLASIEDLFSLPHLGFAAAPGLHRFAADVYNAG